jgi:hypothetical protein
LNSRFVPVYTSNEDYGTGGAVADEEKKVYQRIYHEALKEKRPAGSVCVYLVGPDGKGLASMIVSEAAKADQLRQLLEKTANDLKVEAGKPLVAPALQSVSPKVPAGSLVLHLVSRVSHRFSWGEFPSEDWIVLTADEAKKLLPPAGVAKGASWDVDREVSARILTHFYPQTETCHLAADTAADGPHKHRIERQELKATVLSADKDRIRVKLIGSVKLKHTFYPNRDDDNIATATVVGYLDADPAGTKPPALRLVTEEGQYGRFGFSVAARTMP